MRILVTGGAGFIASHVVDAYLAAGHTLAILDDFSTGKENQVSGSVKIYRGSIEDKAFVQESLTDFQPEVVNHHAAQISVVVSTREPEIDASRNIVGTIHLLQAARHTESVQKFIYASSGGAMYGNQEILPTTEETFPEPVSPYGLSKYTAERYVWLLAKGAKFTATVLRYSNVYGPRQDPHGEAGVCAIFAGKMVKGEPVTIFGDGNQVRDYVYVGDVAAVNVLALQKGEGSAYNICTGIGTTTNQVFQVLKEATKYPLGAVYEPGRPGDAQAVILDPSKAEKELGWKAAIDFKTGTEKTIAWYGRS